MPDPESGPGGTGVYGVLLVGSAQVALPLSELREVIPCPAELIALPVAAPGLLGAVDLRHQVIPVMDLRVLLGMPPLDRQDRVVMIAVRGGQVIGLLADAVCGVTAVAADALRPIRSEGADPLLVCRTFKRPEDGSVVSVLDLAAVTGRSGVPIVQDGPVAGNAPAPAADRPADEATGSATGSATGAAASSGARSLLLARCGRINLGIDIAHVHATLPSLDVRPSPLAHGSCRGVVDYGDLEVPVVDPLDLMALGSLAGERVQGAILRTERGMVVLLLTEILEILRVEPHEVLALPPFLVHRPEFFEGVLHPDDLGEFLVLRAQTLLAQQSLQTLSGLNTGGSGPAGRTGSAEEAGQDDGRREVYLTYSIGTDLATPLSQVLEILPYPEGIAPLDDGSDAVVGLVTHRDGVVPLVCLATLSGRSERPDPATGCVLVVAAGTVRVGLIVLGLRAIERSIWEEAPSDRQRPPTGDPLTRALADQVLIRTAPIGAEPRMLPRVDLSAIAAALTTHYRGGLLTGQSELLAG